MSHCHIPHQSIIESFFCFDTDLSFTQVYCERNLMFIIREAFRCLSILIKHQLNHVFRIATNPRQFIERGSYVLFKFFVDGEALSEVTKNALQIAKLFQFLSIILFLWGVVVEYCDRFLSLHESFLTSFFSFGLFFFLSPLLFRFDQF